MGLYIKGMKMPENCSECPVALSGKYCRINKTGETFKALPIRPNHCPIVALPDHHGQLIDFDALIEKYWDGNSMMITEWDLKDIKAVIETEDSE